MIAHFLCEKCFLVCKNCFLKVYLLYIRKSSKDMKTPSVLGGRGRFPYLFQGILTMFFTCSSFFVILPWDRIPGRLLPDRQPAVHQ